MQPAKITLAFMMSFVILMTTGCSVLFFQCSLAYDSFSLVRGSEKHPVTGVPVYIRVPNSSDATTAKEEPETRLIDLTTTNELGVATFQAGHEKLELNIDGDIVLLDLRKNEAIYSGAIIGNGKPTKIPVYEKDGRTIVVLPEWGADASGPQFK